MFGESSQRRHPPPDTTSSGLLAGLKRNDDTSWERFVRRYSLWLVRHCRRKGIKRADAEDITAEVITKAWQAIPQFRRRRRGSLRKWLLTITDRAVVDFFRRNAKQAEVEANTRQLAELPARLGVAAENTDPKAVEQLLQAMETVRRSVEPHTWEAFVEVYVYKQDAAEVAKKLEINRESVWKAGQRIVRRLRKLLSPSDAQP